MSKIEFSKEVKKWAHVWKPKEDCTSEEIDIINGIFNDSRLKWNKKRKCFILNSLYMNTKGLQRLTFLPPLIIEDTFSCSFNFIESLEGGPIEAKKYYCYFNNLININKKN